MPWLPDIIHSSEAPQALTRRKFAEALDFHGFAVRATPFGIVYVDRRHLRMPPVRQVFRRDVGGAPYVDRLATLRHLLHERREHLRWRRSSFGAIAARLTWICRPEEWDRGQVEATSEASVSVLIGAVAATRRKR